MKNEGIELIHLAMEPGRFHGQSIDESLNRTLYSKRLQLTFVFDNPTQDQTEAILAMVREVLTSPIWMRPDPIDTTGTVIVGELTEG